MRRHERPIFRAWNMRHSQRVPHNNILSINGAVGFRPVGQTFLFVAEIDIVTRCEHFVRTVRSYPQVLVDESGFESRIRLRCCERDRVLTRQKQIAG